MQESIAILFLLGHKVVYVGHCWYIGTLHQTCFTADVYMWYLINMFYTTDPWVGVFLIVSRLLHRLVVDFSNHKWVDSRVTRSEPRLGCVQLLHIWTWLETSLWNKQSFNLHLKVPTLGIDPGWHFCLIKAFSHNCVFSVLSHAIFMDLLVNPDLLWLMLSSRSGGKAQLNRILHSQSCYSLNEKTNALSAMPWVR
jgi:hypothetical protein